jgi:hypothetical protein
MSRRYFKLVVDVAQQFPLVPPGQWIGVNVSFGQPDNAQLEASGGAQEAPAPWVISTRAADVDDDGEAPATSTP